MPAASPVIAPSETIDCQAAASAALTRLCRSLVKAVGPNASIGVLPTATREGVDLADAEDVITELRAAGSRRVWSPDRLWAEFCPSGAPLEAPLGRAALERSAPLFGVDVLWYAERIDPERVHVIAWDARRGAPLVEGDLDRPRTQVATSAGRAVERLSWGPASDIDAAWALLGRRVAAIIADPGSAVVVLPPEPWSESAESAELASGYDALALEAADRSGGGEPTPISWRGVEYDDLPQLARDLARRLRELLEGPQVRLRTTWATRVASTIFAARPALVCRSLLDPRAGADGGEPAQLVAVLGASARRDLLPIIGARSTDFVLLSIDPRARRVTATLLAGRTCEPQAETWAALDDAVADEFEGEHP